MWQEGVRVRDEVGEGEAGVGGGVGVGERGVRVLNVMEG